jgi:outer membrane protein OmpA-like peptidoglycan-associated protein
MNVVTRSILAAIAALAAGCAITPTANESLTRARAAYTAAQADPHVRQYAPAELSRAGLALKRAEQLAGENAGSEWVEHHAYLATRHSQISQHTAAMRAAEAQLSQASAERERVMLQARARTAEAARARAESQASEADAARLAAIEASRKAEAARAEQARAAEAEANAKLNMELQRLQSQVAELQTLQTERGMMLRFAGDVLFDIGQADLKPGARRTLDNLARVLKEQPERSITIEGFTDNTGNAEANQRLSERRAEAVKTALVQAGIPAGSIQTRGMGESYPVASNANATGRQLNRHVEILLPIAQDGSATGPGR